MLPTGMLARKMSRGESNQQILSTSTLKMSGLRSKINTALKGYWLIELLDYYDDIWKPKLKPGGFKNVVTTIAYVKAFRKANYPGGDVFLSQLSMEVATNFEHFVRNNPLKVYDRCEGNGLAKHVQ